MLGRSFHTIKTERRKTIPGTPSALLLLSLVFYGSLASGAGDTSNTLQEPPIPLNQANFSSIRDNLAGHYVLLEDIDLQSFSRPVTEPTHRNVLFTGALNGNGHILKNYAVNDRYSSYAALFPRCEDATFKDIGFVDFEITARSGSAVIGEGNRITFQKIFAEDLRVYGGIRGGSASFLAYQCEDCLFEDFSVSGELHPGRGFDTTSLTSTESTASHGTSGEENSLVCAPSSDLKNGKNGHNGSSGRNPGNADHAGVAAGIASEDERSVFRRGYIGGVFTGVNGGNGGSGGNGQHGGNGGAPGSDSNGDGPDSDNNVNANFIALASRNGGSGGNGGNGADGGNGGDGTFAAGLSGRSTESVVEDILVTASLTAGSGGQGGNGSNGGNGGNGANAKAARHRHSGSICVAGLTNLPGGRGGNGGCPGAGGRGGRGGKAGSVSGLFGSQSNTQVRRVQFLGQLNHSARPGSHGQPGVPGVAGTVGSGSAGSEIIYIPSAPDVINILGNGADGEVSCTNTSTPSPGPADPGFLAGISGHASGTNSTLLQSLVAAQFNTTGEAPVYAFYGASAPETPAPEASFHEANLTDLAGTPADQLTAPETYRNAGWDDDQWLLEDSFYPLQTRFFRPGEVVTEGNIRHLMVTGQSILAIVNLPRYQLAGASYLIRCDTTSASLNDQCSLRLIRKGRDLVIVDTVSEDARGGLDITYHVLAWPASKQRPFLAHFDADELTGGLNLDRAQQIELPSVMTASVYLGGDSEHHGSCVLLTNTHNVFSFCPNGNSIEKREFPAPPEAPEGTQVEFGSLWADASHRLYIDLKFVSDSESQQGVQTYQDFGLGLFGGQLRTVDADETSDNNPAILDLYGTNTNTYLLIKKDDGFRIDILDSTGTTPWVADVPQVSPDKAILFFYNEELYVAAKGQQKINLYSFVSAGATGAISRQWDIPLPDNSKIEFLRFHLRGDTPELIVAGSQADNQAYWERFPLFGTPSTEPASSIEPDNQDSAQALTMTITTALITALMTMAELL